MEQSLILSLGYTPYMHLYLTRITPLIKVRKRPSFWPFSQQTRFDPEKASIALRASIHAFLLLPAEESLYWYLHGFFKNGREVSHERGKRAFMEKVVHGYALWASLAFWWPTYGAMYTVVPLHLGNLMIDCCGLAWAVILSYLGTT